MLQRLNNLLNTATQLMDQTRTSALQLNASRVILSDHMSTAANHLFVKTPFCR
jgi:hypothetical protein